MLIKFTSNSQQFLELKFTLTRCRKLPKGMKDWPAFIELKKKIDDFNETCPLLEMMANKSMKDRHWLRLEKLLNCPFDVENDEFTLKNVMEAPLLKYKDDVEVIWPDTHLSRMFLVCTFYCLIFFCAGLIYSFS